MSSWVAVDFQYLAMVLFGVFAIVFGLWSIWKRKLDLGLRGNMASKYYITLTGNYAIVSGIGLILGGTLLTVSTLFRQQLNFADATLVLFDVTGIIIMLGVSVLAGIFQFAVNLGRDLGKQPSTEEDQQT